MNRRDFLKSTLTIAALAPFCRLAAQSGLDTAAGEKLLRPLGRTGLQVSPISLGVEGFKNKSFAETKAILDYASANDVNFIDICIADPKMLDDMGKVIRPKRDQFVIQGHIGTVWENGQYRRTRNLATSQKAYEKMLEAFGGVIDVGMIHYVDDDSDFTRIFNGEILAYAKKLKADGKIKFIGLSSHSPAIAKKAVESGVIDVLMFSINPGYDLRPSGNRIQFDRERQELYELCARRGVGIDVMKAYGGGDLLSERLSPFGKAFTPVQALNYALTRPAVAAVMVGCRNIDQIKAAVAWNTATAAEKDYTRVFSGLDAKSWAGHCLYCGHCAPCPKKINIADVNKYLNLAIAQNEVPATVRDHYKLLKAHASDCIQCGACEKRCPFQVPIREKMKQAVKVFGV